MANQSPSIATASLIYHAMTALFILVGLAISALKLHFLFQN